MNKKSKLVFICGVALAMLTLSTQQTAKADTTSDDQVENVASTDQTATPTTQTVSEATQDAPVQPAATTQTSTTQVATNDDQQSQQAVSQATSTPTVDTTANTQATTQDATTGNITHIKGIVTTKDHLTSLYSKDGTMIGNRVVTVL